MTNFQIYKKTLGFSLRRVLIDFFTLILFAGLIAAGYFILEKVNGNGMIGLLIGLFAAIIAAVIISRFVSFKLKAGQIAMMTKGVTEGELPDDVISAGKNVVKERFLTVAAYFAVTNAIKGVFNELGRLLTKAGERIGGNTGKTVGSVVSSAVATLISYLCDCCLGWVFFRKDKGAFKASCEGAVLFFKHGKALLKNVGRIFGIGLLSFVVIGGVFFLIFALILSNFMEFFQTMAVWLAENAESAEEFPELLKDPQMLMIGSSILLAVIIWSFLHSTFIRPFVLTGVLRNYMEAGINDMPTEESFDSVKNVSRKFAKLAEKADA